MQEALTINYYFAFEMTLAKIMLTFHLTKQVNNLD
jgi:hypothetical protein